MKKRIVFFFCMLSSFFSWMAFLFAAPNAPANPAEKGFAIYNSGFDEYSPAVAYNYVNDVFLVVAQVRDTLHGGSDIYGQFVKSDGTMNGGRFPICLHSSGQYTPDVAFGKNNEYLVVWEDYREGNADIWGPGLMPRGKS